MLRDELDHLDFKIIKKEKEELINTLENKLIKVSQSTITIKTDLDQAIDALSSIDKLYKDGDVRKKREIVGSIYPKKLIFDGTQYRTARLNEVVQLIYTLDNGFSKKKMDKPIKISICPLWYRVRELVRTPIKVW